MVILALFPSLSFAASNDNPALTKSVKKAIRLTETWTDQHQKESYLVSFHVDETGKIVVDDLKGSYEFGIEHITRELEQIQIKNGDFIPNQTIKLKLTFIKEN